MFQSELRTYSPSLVHRCVRLNWSHENAREVFCHSKWLYTVCSRLDWRDCYYDIYGMTSKPSSVFHNARLTENDLTLLQYRFSVLEFWSDSTPLDYNLRSALHFFSGQLTTFSTKKKLSGQNFCSEETVGVLYRYLYISVTNLSRDIDFNATESKPQSSR
jgi:hypothetical protein